MSRRAAALPHPIPGNLLRGPVGVHLVGVGGSGSQMLTGLARLHAALLALGHEGGLRVTAYDPDVVSPANVGRQLFSPADVGHPKATVLIHRLNCFFGLDWQAVFERWRLPKDYGLNLLISCVDTARARREIDAALTGSGDRGPEYWLDVGNRQQDGQVVLGQPRRFPRPGESAERRAKTRDTPARLRTVMELFPELSDASLPEDDAPSCSLAEALERQDLFINQAVTTFALHLLWRLFRDGGLDYHGGFINLTTGQVNPLPIPRVERGRGDRDG